MAAIVPPNQQNLPNAPDAGALIPLNNAGGAVQPHGNAPFGVIKGAMRVNPSAQIVPVRERLLNNPLENIAIRELDIIAAYEITGASYQVGNLTHADLLSQVYQQPSVFLNMPRLVIPPIGGAVTAANRARIAAWFFATAVHAKPYDPPTEPKDLIPFFGLYLSMVGFQLPDTNPPILTYSPTESHGMVEFLEYWNQRLTAEAEARTTAARVLDPNAPDEVAMQITAATFVEYFLEPINRDLCARMEQILNIMFHWVMVAITSGGQMTEKRVAKKLSEAPGFDTFPFTSANVRDVGNLTAGLFLRPEIASQFYRTLHAHPGLPVIPRTMIEQMPWTRMTGFRSVFGVLNDRATAPWEWVFGTFGQDGLNFRIAMHIVYNSGREREFLGYQMNLGPLAPTNYPRLFYISTLLGPDSMKAFKNNPRNLSAVDTRLCRRFAAAVHKMAEIGGVGVDIGPLRQLMAAMLDPTIDFADVIPVTYAESLQEYIGNDPAINTEIDRMALGLPGPAGRVEEQQ